MKTTINEYQFLQGFHDRDRGENFSYAGLKALYKHLTEYEDDCGEDIEYDPIAICCEYTEYEDLAEFNEEYGEEFESVEEIEDNTTVIRVGEESFIIQNY
jgi:hypothetical protein